MDDPASRYYNQWVEDSSQRDWNSGEHLADYSTSYAYAFVIDYNRDPIIPGAGSAIFFHCENSTTMGCVSTATENVLQFLRWLSPEDQPGILILRRRRTKRRKKFSVKTFPKSLWKSRGQRSLDFPQLARPA